MLMTMAAPGSSINNGFLRSPSSTCLGHRKCERYLVFCTHWVRSACQEQQSYCAMQRAMQQDSCRACRVLRDARNTPSRLLDGSSGTDIFPSTIHIHTCMILPRSTAASSHLHTGQAARLRRPLRGAFGPESTHLSLAPAAMKVD